VLLQFLNGLLEERVFIRHSHLLELFDVLRFNRCQVDKELLVEHDKALVAGELGQKVVNVVKVDGIPNLLVVNHQERRFVHFSYCKQDLLQVVGKLQGV
jgi:endonuclease/exonuclease/phosphatase (EEP) superfamily protein YafD